MKTCANCKIEKQYQCFHKSSKSGLQSYCIPCKKLMDAEIYKNNPNKKIKNKIHKQLFWEWYRELKTDVPCVDCHKIYPYYVMQWDHINNDKEFTIGSMRQNLNKEKILKEIEKCELVCANCHCERTWQRTQVAI